jgi:hypothetical protein
VLGVRCVCVTKPARFLGSLDPDLCKFRVAREIRESERKKIEAEGISEFQRIVSQGINPSYLRWRGIEATLQLAQSSNSKIVIVGTGKDGLLVILGNFDGSPSPEPASPAGNGETAPKERTTAATSTRSLDQTPPETLSKPSEKTLSTQPPEGQPVPRRVNAAPRGVLFGCPRLRPSG